VAVTPEFGGAARSDLLLTRLAPPAQQTRLLRRQRVDTALAAALEYPLCLVVAPPGSGKTTALAALAATGGWPAAWCRARAGDDPALLLRHLAAAFRPVAPLDEAAVAAAVARAPGDPGPALETLVNELAAALDDDTLLILDDFHLVEASPALRALVDDLLAIQPLRLHVVLASRVEPTLAAADLARLRGELLAVGPAELAFDAAEARALFALAGQHPPTALDALLDASRGWPLALQAALGADDWRAALGLRGPGPLDAYLAQHALGDLPDELQRFLIYTAPLRRLDPALCALLLDGEAPGPFLDQLRRRRLFVDEENGVLRLQPIFYAFLERRARRALDAWPELHRRAAAFFRLAGDAGSQVHHLLAAGDAEPAMAAIVIAAPDLLAEGRPELVLEWIEGLPVLLRAHPRLLELQAAALRQLGRYDEALAAEAAAERVYAASGDLDGQVRTLRGLAEVYLDTVQPAHATDLLKRALKLLPHERADERAALLRMQAENWANRGRADVALILERAARAMEQGQGDAAGAPSGGSPSPPPPVPPSSRPPLAPPAPAPAPPLPPRLLLRSGRLNEARQQLEAQLWAEARGGEARLGAHREPLLLLALIYALLGSGTRALAMARRGLAEAQEANARLTEAIAQLRLGHAYQLVAPGDLSPATQRYTEALRLINSVGVARTRAEGLLGLTLLAGHSGDLQRAEADAREGLQIAAAAGDEWTAALILLALGGAAVAAGEPRALGWLEQAHQRFARGGDTYGQAIVGLWRAIHALRSGDAAAADAEMARLLDAVVRYGYVGVLVAPSLLGPRDMATVVPLLLRGRSLPGHGEAARHLLREGFPTIAADDTVDDYHPGYTLRVQMLGTFRVWRGPQEIQAREWQREKARQLFQLLLTYRGHWVQREQICAWLWPEADLESAERQFKVTLNALNTALEPTRPPRVAPFFIRRQGLAYSFAPSYGVWIDVDEFELRAQAGLASGDPEFARRNAHIAVQLYRGDYLAESLYDQWTTEERERLLARYLATAVSYAEQVSREGDQAQAVQLCEQVLRRDRCYEEAYQTLMRAHSCAGSRSQALRSYIRCVQALQDDLGMEPLPETVTLYERLKRNEAI
jgi:ATP/maltotriose-dependent transcriptional regulator MalT/DNA-binding SARP family transcriptional activator